MPKPPDDLDFDNFVIGKGAYTNVVTWLPFCDSTTFRIVPAPLPTNRLAIMNLIFATTFFLFWWFLKTKAKPTPGIELEIAVSCIGIFTCSLFTLITVLVFDNANKLGPWLEIDRATGLVKLPRENCVFDLSEIECLQNISTKRVFAGGKYDDVTWDPDRVSEFNLVTNVDGKRVRWPLLRSIDENDPYNDLAYAIKKSTPVPVVRIKDTRGGWKVATRQY